MPFVIKRNFQTLFRCYKILYDQVLMLIIRQIILILRFIWVKVYLNCVVFNDIRFVSYFVENHNDKVKHEYKKQYNVSVKRGFYNISNILRLANLGIDLKNEIKKFEKNKCKINKLIMSCKLMPYNNKTYKKR